MVLVPAIGTFAVGTEGVPSTPYPGSIQGSAENSSDATAVLSRAIPISGSAASVSEATASISTDVPTSGSAPTANEATAALSRTRPVDGSADAANGITASVSRTRGIAGSAANASSAKIQSLIGIAPNASSASGDLTRSRAVTAVADQASDASASATVAMEASGSGDNANEATATPSRTRSVDGYAESANEADATISIGMGVSGSGDNANGAEASSLTGSISISGAAASANSAYAVDYSATSGPVSSSLRGYLDFVGVNRWRFIDPVNNDIYYFTVNPSTNPTTAGSAGRLKSIAYTTLTNADSKTLVFKKSGESRKVQITGSITSSDQLYQLETWAKKRHPVRLRDDLERELEVYVESFEPRREHKVNMPYYHTYTLTYAVV
jgi:hypothetical protein